MALSKLAPGIISITGKMAGNVFKRDASGQHTVSYPRVLHKPSTPKQKNQRAWYAGKKREERHGGPPPPGTDPPKTPGTVGVYAITEIVSKRVTSIGCPIPITLGVMSQFPEPLENWILLNKGWIWVKYQLNENAVRCAASWYMKIRELSWGQVEYEAALDTIGDLTYFFGTALTKTLSNTISVLNTYLVLFTIFQLYDWLWPGMGANYPPAGAVILRHANRLDWGGLLARPSDDFFDFVAGPTTAFQFFSLGMYGPWPQYRDGGIELLSLWQTTEPHTIYHYTYTWKLLNFWFLGYAYIIDPSLYRLETDDYIIPIINKPVGWSTTPAMALDYLNHITENWQRF